jgi:hypothetical protein
MTGAAEGRKPTVDEAVAWLLQAKTREYRLACLRHWRTLYGDEFSNAVEARVRREWGKKQPRR